MTAAGFTKHDMKVMGTGLLASLNRLAEYQRVTIKVEFKDMNRYHLIDQIQRMPGVREATLEYEGNETMAGLLAKVASLEARLKSAQEYIEQMNEQMDTLAMERRKPRREVTVPVWAKEMGWSYSKAYRAMQDGLIQSKKMGGGKIKKGWVVYPDTYTPRIAKAKGRRNKHQ